MGRRTASPRRRRLARPRTLAAGCAAGAAAALLLFSATPAGADPHTAGRDGLYPARRDGPYYVAIGASESVGVQPEPWHRRGVGGYADHLGRDVAGDGDHLERTDRGYADDLERMEQSRWPGLQLVDFGCPGMTAQGALDGVGNCRYAAGSEVATAVSFLRAHPGDVALVTVDLGFNDIWPCLAHYAVDETCVDGALRRISSAIRAVLTQVRDAGGQDMLVVGLQHADPYVADALFGKADFARETVTVFDRMNEVLGSVYRQAGAVVARVPAWKGSAVGPRAVGSTCTRTWMCTDHNIHPTAAGYRVIANAIADAIAGTGPASAGTGSASAG